VIQNSDNLSDKDIQFVVDDQLFLETLLKEIRKMGICHMLLIRQNMQESEKELIDTINKIEADNIW